MNMFMVPEHDSLPGEQPVSLCVTTSKKIDNRHRQLSLPNRVGSFVLSLFELYLCQQLSGTGSGVSIHLISSDTFMNSRCVFAQSGLWVASGASSHSQVYRWFAPFSHFSHHLLFLSLSAWSTPVLQPSGQNREGIV